MQDNLTWIVYDQLLSALKEADPQRFRELLSSSPLEVWELKDSRCLTLFHNLSSCFFREDRLNEFSKILVDYCNAKYAKQVSDAYKLALKIRETQTGKTALMFAVQSNQKAYVKLLIDIGADPHEVDSDGLGIVHFAAMLDYAALLAYFYKELKLGIMKPDVKGRIPLHLAAFDGSYHTSDLLIAWNSPIEQKDFQGNTPLHLASFGNLPGNYRIVRHLLIKGAERNARNHSDKTPFEIAQETSNHDVADALRDPGCLSSCNPCSTTLAKPKFKLKAFVLFHLIQIFRNGVLAECVLPAMHFALVGYYCLICFLSLLSFIIVSNKDPGYVNPIMKPKLVDLYETFNPDYVCFYCESLRTPSTKHCQYCQKCVRHFDHHCPWINNCIGMNNFKVFLIFIFALMLEYLSSITVIILWLAGVHESQGTSYSVPYHLGPGIVEYSLVLADLSLTSLCVIAMSPLLYVQLTNVLMKTTTRERFIVTDKQRRASTQSHRSTNESERLIQAERELLVPMSIDSSALTDGFVFLATTRVCCCSEKVEPVG
mmetsp:Transcript_27223/g.48916  ORF Transcript_27223/g.48916 Transcript_27223/m.48916 type:complete len:542 (-) Transcript_27223:23-1648(-)